MQGYVERLLRILPQHAGLFFQFWLFHLLLKLVTIQVQSFGLCRIFSQMRLPMWVIRLCENLITLLCSPPTLFEHSRLVTMEALPLIFSPGSGFFPSPLRPKLQHGHQASFSPSPKAPSRRPISVCDPCRKRLALFPISIFALLHSSETLYIYNTLLRITVKPYYEHYGVKPWLRTY